MGGTNPARIRYFEMAPNPWVLDYSPRVPRLSRWQQIVAYLGVLF